MKHITDTCFIIYARLRSERMPFKMLEPFAGTSLIDIALNKILQCPQVIRPNFYLCVHEPELIAKGKQYGVNVFERSRESAEEDSRLPVLMEWWDKLPFTYCVAISAAAPCLRVRTIGSFIDTFRKSDAEGMVSVRPQKTYHWNEAMELVTPWPEGQDLMNTKAVETTYEVVGALFAGRLDTIGEGKWMGSFQQPGDPALFPLPYSDEALDIDTPMDFQISEAYYNTHWRAAVHPAEELVFDLTGEPIIIPPEGLSH